MKVGSQRDSENGAGDHYSRVESYDYWPSV